MTFARQVLYLLTRDIARLTPWLLLFGVVLVFAVGRAVELRLIASATLPTYVAVILCLAFASAVPVLADSPTRDDAFWATQPIDARALALAKLLSALLLIAMHGVALILVMNAWSYPVRSAGIVAGTSLTALSAWALGVAVIAAACARQAVAGLVIGSLITLVLTVGGSALLASRLAPLAWGLVALVLIAVGAITFVGMYRRRPTDRVSRAAAMVVGAVLLVFSALTPPVISLTAATAYGQADGVTLRVPLVGQPECDRGVIIIPFEVSSPSWARVDLTKPQASLALTDGRTVELANSDWRQAAGVWGPLVAPALFRGVVDDEQHASDRRTRRADIAFVLPDRSRDMVCGRIARIALRLEVRSATGVEVMRLPLRSGATEAAPGIRSRIIDAGRPDSAPAITVELSSLASLHGAGERDVEGLEFALVDPQSGAVVRLDNQAVDGWMRTSDLMGLSRVWGSQRLVLDRPSLRTANALKTWYRDAHIVVTAPVWRSRAQRIITVAVAPSLAVKPMPSAAFGRR